MLTAYAEASLVLDLARLGRQATTCSTGTALDLVTDTGDRFVLVTPGTVADRLTPVAR